MSKDEWNKVVPSTNDAWDRQKPIEGVFIKRQSGVGPNDSMLYTLHTTDGDIGVWGSTVLDSKFAELELHCLVKIEPLGKQKSPKSGKDYWDFEVSWKENPNKADGEEIPLEDIPFGE